ncbi:MAG TPA: hypothetical protein VMF31_14575 [Solirubrobacterales bacterium]|nr:hypothetical protein [Solirubrobacterales bacterium]
MSDKDLNLAREIAEFVADRAFDFGHHECRAWALTDFSAWASLAGRRARLTLAAPVTAEGDERSP